MVNSSSYDKYLNTVLIAFETLLCGGLFLVYIKLTQDTNYEKVMISPTIQVAMMVMLIYAICASIVGVVLFKRKVLAYEVISKVFKTVCLFGISSVYILRYGHFMDSWSYMYGIYILSVMILLFVERLTWRFLIKRYRTEGGNLRFVVLVGSSRSMMELYDEIVSQDWAGYKVLGYFDYEKNEMMPEGCRYLGKPDGLEEFIKNNRNVHYLYCGLRDNHSKDIVNIITLCENNIIRFFSVPNMHNYLQNKVYLGFMGNVPILKLREDPMSRIGNKLLKRAFDLVFSTLFLCTVFPIVLIIVTIVTKITMPGPVFFRQKRNGLNDKEFYCLKFRSMKVNADADRLQATKDDPRKTKWGNIMRKTNIDELPQFINVFMGDMSVVGPRPHMLKHTIEYSKLIDKYMVRHLVKPGITGWSQVTGYRGETKELKDMQGRIKGDIWYIENWSFWLDLYIIYKTVANVFKGEEKAY